MQEIKDLLKSLKSPLQPSSPSPSPSRGRSTDFHSRGQKNSLAVSPKACHPPGVPPALLPQSYAQVARPSAAQLDAAKFLQPKRSQKYTTTKYTSDDTCNVYFANFKGNLPFSSVREKLNLSGVNVKKVLNIDYLSGSRVQFIIIKSYESEFTSTMKALQFTHLKNYDPYTIKNDTISDSQKEYIFKL